jgi:hypothetical protein
LDFGNVLMVLYFLFALFGLVFFIIMSLLDFCELYHNKFG